MSCFQVNVGGSGTGAPPTVKIPGVYSANDPGIKFDKWSKPKSYTMPGPKVWNGN